MAPKRLIGRPSTGQNGRGSRPCAGRDWREIVSSDGIASYVTFLGRSLRWGGDTVKRQTNNSVQVSGLFGNWRKLPLPELENQITQIRRAAVRQQLSQAQWKLLDRMRRHLVKLNVEATRAREVIERNAIS
jgi:hypothetical protein